MKLVLFSRVPRWYSFKNERLAKRLTAENHEIVGVIVEEVATSKALREWTRKLGFKVFLRKARNKVFKSSNGVKYNANNNLHNVEVNPKVYFVKSHNSDECREILTKLAPDLLVLRGCGIIKKHVLDVPRIGVINPHYAILPDFRGMDVTEWSVLHDAPVAVSVHTVETGVDTGTVLKSRVIEVSTNDSTGSLRDKCAAVAVDLLAESVNEIERTQHLPDATHDATHGKQFFQMHERLRELANRRLSNRTE